MKNDGRNTYTGTFWWLLSAKTGNKLQKGGSAAFLLAMVISMKASGLITFCIIALACTTKGSYLSSAGNLFRSFAR